MVIRYKSNNELKKLILGDWVDLTLNEDVDMKQLELRKLDLGISIELPEGYEAHLVPRSSTPTKHGIMLANSVGIIDNSYNGDDDVWGFTALAVRDTKIPKGTRIAQFRIVQNQPNISFHKVDHLGNKNRGGFGSTGD